MKTPTCKNEFTSECMLQTQFTFYKCTNASIFFILLTTYFLSQQKPCGPVPLCLCRRSQHLSMSLFNALRVMPSLPWWSAALQCKNVKCLLSLWGHFHHDGWIQIRGRQQVQLESNLPHKSNGIIWFYYKPGDRVALWRGVWSVHFGCACIFGILNCCIQCCCRWLLTRLCLCCLNLTVVYVI